MAVYFNGGIDYAAWEPASLEDARAAMWKVANLYKSKPATETMTRKDGLLHVRWELDLG